MFSMTECSHCGKKFKYESERKRHELSHLPRFGCDKCGKKFTYLSALKRHQKQHERTGNVQCDECNHTFKDETLLKRHLKYAHEGTHICSECDAKFSSHQALRIHVLTHKPKSERRYSCSFVNCNKTFNFSHHLKYHEMTHTKSKQHFCDVCGKGFIQSHNLKVHMKIHGPSKWLLCKMANCKKKFISEYALKKHYARHKHFVQEEIKPPDFFCNSVVSEDIPCSSCGQIFLSPLYEEHKCSCLKKKKEISIDPLPKTNIKDNEESKTQNVLVDFKDSEEYLSTCRTTLGKCLITGDENGNANCLCDQMVKAENDCNKIIDKLGTADNKKSIGVINKDIATCKECACSTVISEVEYRCHSKVTDQKIKQINRYNNCMPEFEYGINGIVKVINTVDAELEGIANVCNKNNMNIKNEYKIPARKNQTIPYNSCKAVLGSCIVSGNGMMSDDCLCAKMLNDEPQMTSQEMEEITPQPNDSSLCL